MEKVLNIVVVIIYKILIIIMIVMKLINCSKFLGVIDGFVILKIFFFSFKIER